MSGAAPNELGLTIKRFIGWARRQGWLYRMAPTHLGQLARFLERRGVQRVGEVNATLLAEYQRFLSLQKSPATVNGHLNTVRAWWRYLLKEELVVEDATRCLRPVRPDYFVPHLYSAQELWRIERATVAAIHQAHTPRHRFSRQTRHAAFGLLRDSGLRVSEACRLDVNHYDPRERTLRIERTKFFKTRHIPLPRTTCALLGQYLKHRHQLVGDTGESPALFVSQHGRRLNRVVLEVHFKHLLCELGLYQPRRHQGRTVFGSTNLHALRHSFAVRTLERWQLEGHDVEHLLPLLSGYLGHVKVSYTKHYLHLTPTLRQLGSERFAERVLPRLDRSAALTHDE
jgi:integrase/recombinase XerD